MRYDSLLIPNSLPKLFHSSASLPSRRLTTTIKAMIPGWVGIRQDHDKRGKIASSGRYPWWTRRAKRAQNGLGIGSPPQKLEPLRARMSYLQQAATSGGSSYCYSMASRLTLAPTPAGITPMPDMSRRALVKAAGMVSASMLPRALCSTAASAQEHAVPPASSSGPSVAVAATPAAAQPTTYLFLNNDEAAFIEAAVDRLIPADPQWPGGIEAGVPNYIDKQLGGAWGAGERLYRSGPWQPGTPSQGYQLPFTPAELFRTALGAINKQLSEAGTPFASMSADQQDVYLHSLEAGGKDLGGIPSDVFFEHLWDSTVEGFLSDPVYGGNRNMVSWRMIGFPGAYASYYDLVDQHGIKLDRSPMSLAEDAQGHIHMDPGIHARLP
jgi:gluconate 2-dehydrogenase gamma chain